MAVRSAEWCGTGKEPPDERELGQWLCQGFLGLRKRRKHPMKLAKGGMTTEAGGDTGGSVDGGVAEAAWWLQVVGHGMRKAFVF